MPSGPGYASAAEVAAAVAALVAGRRREVATFTHGVLAAPPDLPGEGPGRYGVCCDRDPFAPFRRNATCDCSGKPDALL